jgi:hypothetical protein
MRNTYLQDAHFGRQEYTMRKLERRRGGSVAAILARTHIQHQTVMLTMYIHNCKCVKTLFENDQFLC